MNKIVAIASNTFREAIRDKILYAILFFAILILMASLALGELSLDQHIRVTKNLGLASISFFGILIAIFIGVSLVHKELDKRTIYTIISKPIQRYQFILGKYVGMLMTAFVQVLVLSVVFAVLLSYQNQWNLIDIKVFSAVYLYWIEIMLLTSVALFFSSFTTPFFSGLFTFSVFLLGRLMNEIVMVGSKTENPVVWGLVKASTLLPNLQYMNIGLNIVHGEVFDAQYLLSTTAYAFFYILVFLLSGMALFSRRDFV